MKKKILLVLAIVFAVLFAVTIGLTVYMGQATSLVSDTGIKTGQQNNVIGYDAEIDTFFIGTRSGKLVAYDNATKEVKWELSLETAKPINAMVVRPATDRIYIGSDDNHVYTIDLNTGAIVNDLDIQRRVMDLDVSTDESKVLVTCKTSSDAYVMTYDLASGEQLSKVKYSYLIKNAVFTEDDTNILLADRRGRFSCITPDGEELFVNDEALHKEIYGFAETADGKYLLADVDGSYAVYDENGNASRVTTVPMIDGAFVRGAGIDANGNVILGTEQGYVYVTNADDELIYEYRQASSIAVSDFVADDNVMYITGWGDYVEVIELAALETIATLNSLAGLIQTVLYSSIALAAVCLLLYFKATYRALCAVGRALWKHKISYLLLIPTFVLLAMFNYTPMFIALARAFTNWSNKRYTAAEIEFVGFENFKKMVTEGYFLIGVKNVLILMITGFIKTLTMPVIAAWLVYSFKNDRKKYIYRFLFVLPIVVPGLVGSLLWKQIYNPQGGLDQILVALGLEEWIHVWLGEEKTAIWSIVFMGPPYIGAMPFLLYYGGFTSIDASLYEAARIDGASRWDIFWRIQIPMIAPQMKLLIMLGFIGSVQDYGGIYLLTGGGPGVATYTPGLELYYNATMFGNYGYACAMGLVLFVFIMIGTFFNNKIKAENYGS